MSRQNQTSQSGQTCQSTPGFQLRQTVDHGIAVLLACVFTLLSGVMLMAATINL